MSEIQREIVRDAAGRVTSFRETAEDHPTTQAVLSQVLDEAIALVEGRSRRPPAFGIPVQVHLDPAQAPHIVDLRTEGPPPHTSGHVHFEFEEPLTPAFREAFRAMYAVYLNGTAASPELHATFQAACGTL
jgi:hypothetical protein